MWHSRLYPQPNWADTRFSDPVGMQGARCHGGHSEHRLCTYQIAVQGGSKSKLLILREYVNKAEKIGGMWTNKNSYRENEVLSDIFTWNIIRHNCFIFYDWKQSMKLLLGSRQTRTSLCKHDGIKVCSIEYLTTQIECFVSCLQSSTVLSCLTYTYTVSHKRIPDIFSSNVSNHCPNFIMFLQFAQTLPGD